MGGRVRGKRGPVVAPGPRVAPPGWARPSDLRRGPLHRPLRPSRRQAWGWVLERAGCLRGKGFTVRSGRLGDLVDWWDVMLCLECPMVCVSARLSPLLFCVCFTF